MFAKVFGAVVVRMGLQMEKQDVRSREHHLEAAQRLDPQELAEDVKAATEVQVAVEP